MVDTNFHQGQAVCGCCCACLWAARSAVRKSTGLALSWPQWYPDPLPIRGIRKCPRCPRCLRTGFHHVPGLYIPTGRGSCDRSRCTRTTAGDLRPIDCAMTGLARQYGDGPRQPRKSTLHDPHGWNCCKSAKRQCRAPRPVMRRAATARFRTDLGPPGPRARTTAIAASACSGRRRSSRLGAAARWPALPPVPRSPQLADHIARVIGVGHERGSESRIGYGREAEPLPNRMSVVD